MEDNNKTATETENERKQYRWVSFLIFAGIILSWLAALFFLVDNNRAVFRISEEVHKEFREWKGLLAAGPMLKEGSDRLTIEAMRFVIFGEEPHMRGYFHEAKVVRSREHAIEQIKMFPQSKGVVKVLEDGLFESVKLMETEYHAMKLAAVALKFDMSDYPPEVRDWKLTETEEALTDAEKRRRAISLIFDNHYNESKERIGRAALSTLHEIITRAHEQYERLRREIELCSTLNKVYTFVSIGLMFLSLAAIIWLGRNRMRSKEQKMLEIVTKERDHALEADKAKSYFFASVSHDIRTPLNSIIGFTDLLKLNDATGKERELYLSGIETSGKQLLALVNDILDLAKLEAGKYVFKPEPVNVSELVAEVVNSLLPQAQREGLTIDIELPEKKSFPYLDRMRFRQVLVNIVGNAIKYTELGGVTVTLACDEATRELVVKVRDTGRGISPDDLKRLMLPYVQLSRNDDRKGTGLGLAVCRQLVEAMHGKIEIESIVGTGSVFTVRLSAVRYADEETQKAVIAAEEVEKARCKALMENPHNSFSGMSLLLVDDLILNLTVAKHLLKTLNVTDVDFASNGSDALKKLESGKKYDAVFTDMWMPTMGGEELVGIIRMDPRWKQLPVFAVTADVEVVKNYRELGFSGTMLKPVTAMSFVDALKTIEPHAA